MNTLSNGMSTSGVPPVSPMYSSARVALARSLASAKAAGSGTRASTPTTCAGLVPQVICGTTSAAEKTSTRS